MKSLFSFYLLLSSYALFADAPGNKPRPDYDVTITGLQQYENYAFYYQRNEEINILHDSNSIVVPGGYGAPMCESLWAVQQKSSKHTDTLYFCSGESDADKSVAIFISENHLSVAVDTANVAIIENSIPYASANQLNDTQSVKNRNIMYLISGLSLVILIMLVFFVWKKNRKSKKQKS